MLLDMQDVRGDGNQQNPEIIKEFRQVGHMEDMYSAKPGNLQRCPRGEQLSQIL